MKTVSQLSTGNKPVGTTAYMARLEQLLQYHSDVKKGMKSKSNVVLVNITMSCNIILVFIPCS